LNRIVHVLLVLLLYVRIAHGGDDPYRVQASFTPANQIDELLLKRLSTRGMKPAGRCSDAVFIRRVYLDLHGVLPPAARVRRFLRDQSPNRRDTLIDELLSNREGFAEYWTMKWCDILRVKAEFPINLWPNGVQAYARWIYEAQRDNMPLDQFARLLLTSSGSNFRVPPVNFYRAVQGESAADLSSAVALTFMGMRTEHMSETEREDLAVFFSRVAFKGTAEWKETIVYLDPSPASSLDVLYPDGREGTIAAGSDPRVAFADWLLNDQNPRFARNIANRVWSWLFGYGLVHEPDDIRAGNPPVHPELLDYLATSFIKSGYDMQELIRLIMRSSAYQQSSIPVNDHPDAERLFAQFPVRRLDAEVLLDALKQLSGKAETYSSAIPEPFTFIPKTLSHKELVDGSITSSALKQFGRSPRDTGLERERSRDMTADARLALLNSSRIHDQLNRSWKLVNDLARAKSASDRPLDQLYLSLLSRYPTEKERKSVADFMSGSTIRRKAAVDLLWALINTKEFLYQH
jgi:hypothetical protein